MISGKDESFTIVIVRRGGTITAISFELTSGDIKMNFEMDTANFCKLVHNNLVPLTEEIERQQA